MAVDSFQTSNPDIQSNQETDTSIHKDGWKMEIVMDQINKDPEYYTKSPVEDMKDGENTES